MSFTKIRFIIYFIVTMWIFFGINLLFPLSGFGLAPRTIHGLLGIITMPFLHGSFVHCMSNTLPMLILGSILVSFYERQAEDVILLIILIGGGLLWVLGRGTNVAGGPVVHIGASSLIYGIAAFLIYYGFLIRKFLAIILSLAVTFTYGVTMVWGILPLNAWISWEGHLFGAIAGIIAARVLKPKNLKAGRIHTSNQD